MKLILIPIIAFAAFPYIEKPPVEQTDRQKVLSVASTQVGIVEKTGKNDGEVEKYIGSVGLDPKAGYPYCAAFNYWVGDEALGKSPYPRSAWSPDQVKGGVRVTASTHIRGGEAFGIYFKSKGRIAHTGLVESFDGKSFITIEANTNANAAVGSAGDRDGQGVYRKRRHWRTVHSVKDWLE
jgi:hypothetical protein|tara:strand:+ start:2269 stop:2811 length:543 start_codon:yes stop_codon:yes gene_type:complete